MLSDDDKEFCKRFVNACNEYLKHRNEASIQDYYFFRTPEENIGPYDSTYHLCNEVNKKSVELGSEEDGLYNLIRFLDALHYDNPYNLSSVQLEHLHKTLMMGDNCYDCTHYNTKCYLACELCSIYGGCVSSEQRTLIRHTGVRNCEYYKKDKEHEISDYTRYDRPDSDWHKMNSVNDWSLYTVEATDYCYFIRDGLKEYTPCRLYFAKHLPSGNILFFGCYRYKYPPFKNYALERARDFYRVITGVNPDEELLTK